MADWSGRLNLMLNFNFWFLLIYWISKNAKKNQLTILTQFSQIWGVVSYPSTRNFISFAVVQKKYFFMSRLLKPQMYNEIISVNLPIDMLRTINQHSFSTRNVSCRLEPSCTYRKTEVSLKFFRSPLNTRCWGKNWKISFKMKIICANCKFVAHGKLNVYVWKVRQESIWFEVGKVTWLIGHARALYWRSIYHSFSSLSTSSIH